MNLADAQKKVRDFIDALPESSVLAVVGRDGVTSITLPRQALVVLLEASKRPSLRIVPRVAPVARCGKPVRSGRAFCELAGEHEGDCE